MSDREAGYGRGGCEHAGFTAMLADHLRLTYEYLRQGDTDSLGSFYAEGVVRLIPGHEPIVGRTELERFHRERDPFGDRWHRVENVLVDGYHASVRGGLIGVDGRDDPVEVPFVDVFTVGVDCLVTEQRSYYHVPLPEVSR